MEGSRSRVRELVSMGKCMCDENSNCHVNVCRSGDGMEPLERIWATRQVDCLGTKLMGGHGFARGRRLKPWRVQVNLHVRETVFKEAN